MYIFFFFYQIIHNTSICRLQEAGHFKAKERLSAEFHSLIGLQSHDADELVLRTSGDYVHVGTRLFLDACMHRRHYEQSKQCYGDIYISL